MSESENSEEFRRKAEKYSIEFSFLFFAFLSVVGLLILYPIIRRRQRLRLQYLRSLSLGANSQAPSLLAIDAGRPSNCRRLHELISCLADADGHVHVWIPPSADVLLHAHDEYLKPYVEENIKEILQRKQASAGNVVEKCDNLDDLASAPNRSMNSYLHAPTVSAAGSALSRAHVSTSGERILGELRTSAAAVPDEMLLHVYRAHAMNAMNILLLHLAQFGGKKYWRQYVWESMDDVDDFLLDRHHLFPYTSIPIDLMTKLSLVYQDVRYGEQLVSRRQSEDVVQIVHAVCFCLRQAAFSLLEADKQKETDLKSDEFQFLPEKLTKSLVDHNPVLILHPLPLRPKNSRFGIRRSETAKRRTRAEKVKMLMREKLRLPVAVQETLRQSRQLVLASANIAAYNISNVFDTVATTAANTTRMLARRVTADVVRFSDTLNGNSGYACENDRIVEVSVVSVSDDDEMTSDDASGRRSLIRRSQSACSAPAGTAYRSNMC